METLKTLSPNANGLYDEDMCKSMEAVDAMIENMRTLAILSAESYGFSGDAILNAVKILSESTIQNLTIREIQELLHDHGYSDDVLMKSYMEYPDHTVSYIDYAKNALSELRGVALELESSELDRINLCKEISNSKSEQEKYFHSKEYKEKRMEMLSKLTKDANAEEDSPEKTKALKKLEMIKKSDTLDFLFDRFQRFQEKELENIATGFLNGPKFEYIWKKYANNVKHLNILPDTVKRFYNMEEMFLHESYHPFNNLFLFIVIRFIAYMNPYNKRDVLYANSLIVKCDHLVYHRFDSPEEEEEFKYVIKSVLNNFMTDHYIRLFEKMNTTSPTHPDRIAKDTKERQTKFDYFMTTLKTELCKSDVMEYLGNDSSLDHMKECLDEMYQEKLSMVTELREDFNTVVSINTPFDELREVFASHKNIETTSDVDGSGNNASEIGDPADDSPNTVNNETPSN